MSFLSDIAADIRYALRGLRASPGFLVAAVVSLALGIGANTAIFTVMNALLLRSLPVHAPEQLVTLTNRIGAADPSYRFPYRFFQAAANERAIADVVASTPVRM